MELLPSQKKYLAIREAAQYFSIGEKRLRQIVEKNQYIADWLIMNGRKRLIDRELFYQWLVETKYI